MIAQSLSIRLLQLVHLSCQSDDDIFTAFTIERRLNGLSFRPRPDSRRKRQYPVDIGGQLQLSLLRKQSRQFGDRWIVFRALRLLHLDQGLDVHYQQLPGNTHCSNLFFWESLTMKPRPRRSGKRHTRHLIHRDGNPLVIAKTMR